MPKLLITISEPQDTWTRREAQRLGIPVSELIRRTLDAQRGADSTTERRASDLACSLYETELRGKSLFDGCKSIAEMQARCAAMRDTLGAYVAAGVALASRVDDDYACLVTDCAQTGKRLKMFKMEEA